MNPFHSEVKKIFSYSCLFFLFSVLVPPVAAADPVLPAAQLQPAVAPLVTINNGDNAWLLASSALVLMMTAPGLILFYGGLVRPKNVLSTMMHSLILMALISAAWMVYGYSLAFGAGNAFFGNPLSHLFLKGVGGAPDADYAGTIPAQTFMLFQMMFAIITPALISGAVAERVKFKAYVVFMLLWMTVVYLPLCHMVWGKGGYLNWALGGKIPVLDFAGGMVVHISSGVSALVFAIMLGKRAGFPREPMVPHNVVLSLVGTGLLWVGWFGFNAGSSISSGLSTAQALTATQVAAASGALSWILIESMHQGKATALGFASGILAGLVAVTPAAGVVQPYGAMILGFLASVVCYSAIQVKNKLGYDDSLDAFGIHGVGGIVGALLLTFFIRPSWMHDAAIAAGGKWTIWNQLGVQGLAVTIAIVYAAVMTLIIIYILNKFIKFKSSETDEMAGMDRSYHGERGYGMLNPS